MSFSGPNQSRLNEYGASVAGTPAGHGPLDLEIPPKRHWWQRRGRKSADEDQSERRHSPDRPPAL